MATTFLYRCPSAAQTVQGWFADEATDDDASYQLVKCLACDARRPPSPETAIAQNRRCFNSPDRADL